VQCDALDRGCTTLTGASTLFVPVFKIDYVPNLPSDYQVNSADSSFDINGVAGGAFVLAEPSVCVNNVATVNFGSANVGLPWDLLIGGAPIKSRSAGALWRPAVASSSTWTWPIRPCRSSTALP
jgi:hypothetical protein